MITRTPNEAREEQALEELRQQLADLRQVLREAVKTARADVAELEDEHWRVHQELNLVARSVGRRAFIRAHRKARLLLKIVAHPIWAARTTGRIIANAPPFRDLHRAWNRGTASRTLLRLLPMADQTTDMANLADAVRWIGPVRIGGRSLQALFCHPASTVTYRVHVMPGARVVAACGLVPQVWDENVGGVEFELRVESEDGGWAEHRALRVQPAARWADRRWRVLQIRVPASTTEHVRVTLSTRLPPNALPDSAWAIWGEPSIELRRSARAIARAGRSALSRARRDGVGTLLRQIRSSDARDEDLTRYRQWIQAHTPTDADLTRMAADSAAWPYQPLISVITPVYNTDPKWLRACIESVRRQAYPNWELCLADDASKSRETIQVLREYETNPNIRVRYLSSNAKISAASNAALDLAQGEYVALLDHDDELAPEALYEVVRYLNDHRDADMIYSDEDKLDLGGARCDPYFKPDWSPEHFMACMYTCHLMTVRRSLVQELGGFRVVYEGAQDYDLVLRLMERTSAVHHIPKMLYRWRKIPQSAANVGDAKPWALDAGKRSLEDAIRRRGAGGEVLPGGAAGLFRVRHRIIGKPLVSIVIPTTGKPRQIGGRDVDLLARCIRSVAQKTSYPEHEILVVADQGRLADTTRKALEHVRHRVIAYSADGPFNFSHKINSGVHQAAGSHILLFNDDMEVISSEWLTALLEYSQQDAIGAVGAKLLYPDGRLQHVGMVLGVCGVAAHAFHQHPGSSPGYASGAIGVRNCSAVTAACMMTRRAVFDEVGGFNEELAVDFNDVDYCLRLRRAGYRIVFTPHAQLYHHESASFGPRLQNPREIERMRALWGAAVERDPYYNPNLSTEFPDYRIRI